MNVNGGSMWALTPLKSDLNPFSFSLTQVGRATPPAGLSKTATSTYVQLHPTFILLEAIAVFSVRYLPGIQIIV